MVLPLKSKLSTNVDMIIGGRLFQIGLPTRTVSYSLIEGGGFAISVVSGIGVVCPEGGEVGWVREAPHPLIPKPATAPAATARAARTKDRRVKLPWPSGLVVGVIVVLSGLATGWVVGTTGGAGAMPPPSCDELVGPADPCTGSTFLEPVAGS
jgi:hypothetical protein